MNLPGVFLPILLTTTMLWPVIIFHAISDSAIPIASINLVNQDSSSQPSSGDWNDCGDPCPK